MAEIVDPSELVRAVGRAKIEYPWSEWADGQTYRVTEGKDFSCSAKSFRSVLSKYAAGNGLKAVIGSPDDSGSVVFRFEARPAGYVPKTRARKGAVVAAEVLNAVVGEVGAETLPEAPEAAPEASGEGEDSSFDW